MEDTLRRSALEYHRRPPPGKISVTPTKGLVNQRDLALAYTPGVAAACEEIARDPAEARKLTSRGNLIGVVTNGTAVLGLGAIGPLAAKPVMEGKSVLFKKFAGIDCFDIEVNEHDPDKLVEIIAALEPTFGGINLEDIKAPECFHIESRLRERMKIPVFHDDQHGTAIIVGAAVLNGLRVVGKDIAKAKLVCSGAGAAALACLDLLVSLGLKPENIWVSDLKGVVYQGRKEEMDPNKARYTRKTSARTLAEIMPGADVFLGLSAGGVLKAEMVAQMADKPLILALANPEPEILPDVAKNVRPDAVIATGRSDFPNQVNNVLCFPFIFRGALDVGATAINEPMKLAAVRAIADLAMAEQSEIVAAAYGEQPLKFGPEYLIPRPFDPRLIVRIAPAVARAAMDSGVATRPIADFDAYNNQLLQFVYHSGLIMKPIFDAAKEGPRRRHALIGAMMIHRGEAEGMICGTFGTYGLHLRYIDQVIGLRPGARNFYATNALMLPKRTVFICDTYVNLDPTAEQLAEMTALAAEAIRRFGVVPRAALLSHSSFGTSDAPSAQKMRTALELISSLTPELEIEGEMHGDAALNAELRLANFPRSRLKEEANLLIMPTLDAANIAFNLLKTAAGDGITIGPILLGAARPVHILTSSATVRRIVNMTALTVGDANAFGEEKQSRTRRS